MWKNSLLSLKKTNVVVLCAVLLAIACAFDFVNPLNLGQTIRISFKFVFMALCGYIAGPIPAILVSASGDILGYILKPIGAYFFGYTVSAAVKGLFYGVFLYRYGNKYLHNKTADIILKSVLANFFINLIANVGLNTVWLSMTMGNVTYELIWARIIKNAVMLPVETAIMVCALLIFKQIESALKIKL